MSGNTERECLKISGIGQSAAKPLSLTDKGKVQRLSLNGVGSERSRSAQGTKKQWSRKFECCQDCGLTVRRHAGNGFCTRCYDRRRWPGRYNRQQADPISKERRRLQALAWKHDNVIENRLYAKGYYYENREMVLREKNELNHGGNYWAVLERDNFTCQRCGKFPVYLVHHMLPGNHDKSLQITLCIGCHVSIHKKKERAPDDERFFV